MKLRSGKSAAFSSKTIETRRIDDDMSRVCGELVILTEDRAAVQTCGTVGKG